MATTYTIWIKIAGIIDDTKAGHTNLIRLINEAESIIDVLEDKDKWTSKELGEGEVWRKENKKGDRILIVEST